MNTKLIIIGIVIIGVLYYMFFKESFQVDKIMTYSKAFFENENTDINNFCTTEYYNKLVNFKNPNSEINTGEKPLYGNVMAYDPSDNSERETKI